MKKLFTFIILGVVLAGLIGPVMVNAQQQLSDCCKIKSGFTFKDKTDDNTYTLNAGCIVGEQNGYCVIDKTKEDLTTPLPVTGCVANTGYCHTKWGMICLLNTIDNVTDWLFFLMSTVAVLLFIIGAVFYMTAGGDPDKAKKGKGLIIYAIIGIVIALVAKMIPSLVMTVIG